MNNHTREIRKLLPTGDVKIVKGYHYLKELRHFLPDKDEKFSILDLGAGQGLSRKIARNALGIEKLDWRGVDIGDSSEHLTRSDDAPPVDLYDGVNLPYKDDSYDVIWCRQVLEHVRYPDKVIAEVSRVVKPMGLFAGSVSQLEPYHSRSIFNWTHYGIKTVFADHGLELIEIAPGADGLLFMLRSIFGYDTGLSTFFDKESPMHSILTALFPDQKDPKNVSVSAAMKALTIAGHIHFIARKV